MFAIQNYTSFLAAIVLFQAIPGAGTLAILNATARHGLAAGFGAVCGTLAGDFIFMVAAVAGLAAVMNANPLLFHALQWFGVAYLCRMGWRLLCCRQEAGNAAAPEPGKTVWRCARQACVVSLTNPKVLLFFVAFFPLFLRPDSSAVTLVAMMAHITVISFLYQSGLVMAGNAVARRLRSWPSAGRVANRIAGGALIAFGVRLAMNNR